MVLQSDDERRSVSRSRADLRCDIDGIDFADLCRDNFRSTIIIVFLFVNLTNATRFEVYEFDTRWPEAVRHRAADANANARLFRFLFSFFFFFFFFFFETKI